ncbi:MAG: hypothetical protein Rhirs2KO_20010 [Rhizobiaceae bacterium]
MTTVRMVAAKTTWATSNRLRPQPDAVFVRVPLTFRSRGGRKIIILPTGADQSSMEAPPAKRSLDETLVRALARAYLWKSMLEQGQPATVSELAQREKVNASYISKLLRLTLLAPAIVEAILEGRQPRELNLEAFVSPLPREWAAQLDTLGFKAG